MPSKKTTVAAQAKPLPKVPQAAKKGAFDDVEEDWKPMPAPAAGKKQYKPSMAFFDQDSD